MDPEEHLPSRYPITLGAHPPHKTPTHNPAGRHAWVIVGEKRIFLCHLIMGWMQGHNYEAVLEVELDRDVLDAVLKDRELNRTHFLGNQGDAPKAPEPPGEGAHAGSDRASGAGHGQHGDPADAAPPADGAESAEAGSATAMLPPHSIPDLQSGRVRRFRADIWNYFPMKADSMAWPYPPDSEFLKDVDVRVLRVVHYRHVNPNVTGQRYESYLLFGGDKEAHLYHQVVDQPDYDHVATLAAVPEWLQPQQLEAGVMVSVPSLPWSADRTHCVNPLPDHEKQEVLYHGYRRYRDPTLKNPNHYVHVPKLEIELDRTWWFSTRVVNYPIEGPCGGLGDVPTPRLEPYPKAG